MSMSSTKYLVVTFRLPVPEDAQGNLEIARNNAYELIFQRAQDATLDAKARLLYQPSGNTELDQAAHMALYEEWNTIRDAAKTANYSFDYSMDNLLTEE